MNSDLGGPARAGWAAALILALAAPAAFAQSAYPRVSLAAGYKVVPGWPDASKGADRLRVVTGVAVDKQDRVWVANTLDPPVRVYSQDGKLLKGWGKGQFINPHFLRIDPEGNVWVADYGMHAVRKFTEDGKLLLTLGTPGQPGEDATHFFRPTDIAFGPGGDLFVTDGYGNNRVVRFDADGKFIKTWGKLGVKAGDFSQPHSIVADSKGRLYVAERNNCRIQVFDKDGRSLAQWRSLINPWGLWISPKDEILVCGSSPARWGSTSNLGNPPSDQLVMKFDVDGRVHEVWAFDLCREGKQTPGCLDWAHGIAADSKGNLYLGDVADESPSHRVQKFLRLEPEG
jgi:sugar lactone lactonase YvrE